MDIALLESINAARSGGEPVVVATRLDTGEKTLWRHGAKSDLAPELIVACEQALRRDRSETVEVDGHRWFIHQYNSSLRMIVIGAVHIAQALVPMASIAGYAVTVVDPRRAFATDTRFPDVSVSTAWPDEAMKELAPDARTAIVTLTHDPKLDDPALAVSLGSDAFYIGSLGSRRTHASRLERLIEQGFTADATDRINGPIGLNIGAASPAEIAIAIMGQVTSALRQPPESSPAKGAGNS